MIELFPKNFEKSNQLVWEDSKISCDNIIKKFPNLNSVHIKPSPLEKAKATDQTLELIAKSCTHLQHLHLSDCRDITDAGLKFLLEKRSDLESLVLIRSNIDYSVFANLAVDLPNFKKLHLYCNKYYIEKGSLLDWTSFKTLINKCPQLEELYIEENIKGGSYLLKTLGDSCPNIKKISIGLWEETSLYETDFIHFVKKCNQLEEIDIRSSLRLTDNFYKMLGESCKNLRSIKVAGKISDIGLAAIIENGKHLERLALAFIPYRNGRSAKYERTDFDEGGSVTKFELENLFKNCTKLSYVQLITCESISTKFFNCLKACNNLEFLDIITLNSMVHCFSNDLNHKHLHIRSF